MKKPTYAFIFLTVFLFSFSNLFSQVVADSTKSSQRVLIKMLDGDEFIGHIISQDDKTIVLNTSNGKMKLIASKIKSVEVYEYEGRFKFPNPHDTRYYFGPSGIPLGKREGYYQNLMLFGNFVNYGITDFLSIGGGFEFLSTVNGNPILFFTPKVGFNVAKKFHLGGGLMILGVTDGGIGTLGYGVATYGSSETNLSLGIGYGGAEGEVFEKPAIMVSFTTRVSNTISLLTENYFISSSDYSVYLGIHGIRIMSKKNAFDTGVIASPELLSSDIPIFPYVGYARSF